MFSHFKKQVLLPDHPCGFAVFSDNKTALVVESLSPWPVSMIRINRIDGALKSALNDVAYQGMTHPVLFVTSTDHGNGSGVEYSG